MIRRVDPHFVVGEGFWIVQRRHHRFVAHFFHHDHGGVLVQRLVHGGHLAELHQLLDDLRGLDRHLVRQLGDGDGLRHVDFEHTHFNRRLLAVAIVTIAFVATATTGSGTPIVATHTTTGVTTSGNGFFLGRIARPARRQFGRLDFLVGAGSGRGCSLRCSCTCSRCGRTCRFVQSAFDRRFGFHFRLIFFGDQHLLGAFIMVRMASASAKALRRRASRS
jgi:hypothetical protein